MKTKTFLLLCLFLGIGLTKISAQTVQVDLRSEFENINAWCLERPITGEFVYHFTFHLDTKTGKVDRVHYNPVHYDIKDAITGEKYIMHDVGHDSGGSQWDFWNNINNYVENEYNVVNGWLPLPEQLPIEGSWVSMNFKLIGKAGNKVTMKWMWQLHVNANGEVTAEKVVEYADCNEP
jgi:hypothetical protein